MDTSHENLHYNPPHFVIPHPKPEDVSPGMLTVLIFISTGCMIISIFDTDKINKNWELTKLWAVALLILVLLKKNTS